MLATHYNSNNGPSGSHGQTRYAMPIANDVRLVSVETARAVLGLTAEQVTERAEDSLRPDHLPAFDLSLDCQSGAHRRKLRIWAGALRQRQPDVQSAIGNANSTFRPPSAIGHWPSAMLDSILAHCLLTDAAGLLKSGFHLNVSQLECAWCISNQHLIRLITVGHLRGIRVGRNWRVNRASAAEFLRRRSL
jgi:hypothetical protein